MKIFSKKSKIWTSIVSACCAIALAIGLPLGLVDFSPKSQPASTDTQGATAPTNDAYWDEAPTDTSRIDTTWSGSGTQADPWLITSAAELAGLSYSIYANTKSIYLNSSYYYGNKYFKQTCDIDVSAYWWQPIGIYYDRAGTQTVRGFSGNYDGGMHTITGIFTEGGEGDEYSYHGLFGYVCGASSAYKASVSNLGIIDSYIQGVSYVGSVAGCFEVGTITNCYSSSSIAGTEEYTGGLVGDASEIIMTNCYNSGYVSGNAYVGGIVGYFYNSTMSRCFNTVTVSGGDGSAGGIIGYGYNYPTVINCFNTGAVTASPGENLGGLMGTMSTYPTIIKCYYGGNCTLTTGVGSGTDTATKISSLNSTSYAKGKTWFTNASNWDSAYPWDFDTVWEINKYKNAGYPAFQWQKPEPTNNSYWDESSSRVDQTWAGSGTEQDPWKITSAAELAGLSYSIYNNTKSTYITTSGGSARYYYSGYYFKQTANIDVSAYWWQSIGFGYNRSGTATNLLFAGNYDGGGFTVSGIFTKASAISNIPEQGLFGNVQGKSESNKATIKNVGIKDSYIQGYQSVGGVAGRAYFSNVTSCYNSSFVKGVNNVGGVIGDAYGTVMSDCYNTGDVKGGNSVGGVLGHAYEHSTINNNYNTGSVTGSGGCVGGVVGNVGKSTVRNNYNTGRVSSTGTYYAGGVVGYADSSTITNCYNIGEVTSTGNRIGGVLGIAYQSSSKLKNCYNIGKVSGNSEAGGVVGYIYTGANVSNCYYGGDCTLSLGAGYGTGTTTKLSNLNTKSYAKNKTWYADDSQTNGSATWDTSNDSYKWDFVNTWKFNRYNDDYPVLKWQADPVVWTDLAETSWETDGTGDGSAARPYVIDSAEKLAGLAKNVNAGNTYASKYFKQTCDISLAGLNWHSIGKSYYYWFAGVYDGGDYSISNIRLNDDGAYQGVFGYIRGEIKNIKIKESYLYSTQSGYVGSLAGFASDGAIIENCFSSATIYNNYNNSGNTGGIIGFAAFPSTIKDSVFTGKLSGYYTGGIMGAGAGEVINCHVENASIVGSAYTGGVVGFNQGGKGIKNCTVSAVIECTTTAGIGGIVGTPMGCTIENVAVNAEIICKANGQAVAFASGSCTIKNCSFVGGCNFEMVPYSSTSSSIITSCYTKINGTAVYSSGDFSDWGLISGMNNDLPMQKALHYMADQSTATGAQVLARLQELGFEAV